MTTKRERVLIYWWTAIALVAAIILFEIFKDARACEGDQGHAYISAGVGKAGTWMASDPQERDKWDDDDGHHALFQLGYRTPIYNNWLWAGAELGHHSTFDKRPPEPELDYFVIKIEARLIP